ncbi:glycosyltransferase family 4 protein [Candidatus Eisenbacteria bacterium]|uniref:Glycosyltransferase family 4 protein n=1 Tax=Eiseniibacteriota bacterium TaxID=2212470 RepID=A0ABV6YKY7_UNCEI
MRTLHVDSGKIWRGGQRQCCLLGSRLAAWGHETHLVCRSESPLWNRCEATGIALHPLRAIGEVDLWAAYVFARLLRGVQPQIVAAHDAHALSIVALGRSLAGRQGRTVQIVYHRRVDVPLGGGFFSRWKVNQADLFICVSRRIAEIVTQSGVAPEKVCVVHSGTRGIDPSRRERGDLLRELGIKPSASVLGTIGGLIPHKGHAVLLEALARLSHAVGDVHLLIIGDGQLRGSLVTQAMRLEIDNRVHFLGERSDLGVLFSAMDLFVHPSLTEGLGSSILDAFSAGIPVVASRTGGIPEAVIDGETGLLAEPGDAGDLSEVIGRALEDRAAGSARACRAKQLFEEHFTHESMAKKTLACYSRLVGKGKR